MEIKFRVWNPDSKKMTYIPNETGSFLHLGGNHGFIMPFEWFVSDNGSSVAYSDRSILMQYIGLKDKNCKAIYQGDILYFTNHEGESFYEGKAEVTSQTCGSSFKTIPTLSEDDMNEKRYDSSMFWHDYETNVEIIGNVHENPELL